MLFVLRSLQNLPYILHLMYSSFQSHVFSAEEPRLTSGYHIGELSRIRSSSPYLFDIIFDIVSLLCSPLATLASLLVLKHTKHVLEGPLHHFTLPGTFSPGYALWLVTPCKVCMQMSPWWRSLPAILCKTLLTLWWHSLWQVSRRTLYLSINCLSLLPECPAHQGRKLVCSGCCDIPHAQSRAQHDGDLLMTLHTCSVEWVLSFCFYRWAQWDAESVRCRTEPKVMQTWLCSFWIQNIRF